MTYRTTRPARYALTAALLGCLSVLTGSPAHSAPIDSRTVYVAMGDSFSAGSGVLPQAPVTTAVPTICLRSAVNYPSLVARALGITRFHDVTCGGAKSTDLAGSQPDLFGSALAPQYDALTADTTLVTLGIGGNDIGLVELAAGCVNPLPEPYGRSCVSDNVTGGTDRVGEHIETFASTYDTIFAEIRHRAPRAQIVLVGYPVAMPPGGCPGAQPAWAADADYLQAKISQLNTVMAARAAAHGVTFVSLDLSTLGHDVCAVGDQSWMVGVVPTSPDAFVPLHPNAASHLNTAQQVLSALSH